MEVEVVVNKNGFEKFLTAIDKTATGSYNIYPTIEITKNMITSTAIDDAKVFMVKGSLACMGNGETVIWINTGKALKLLKLIKSEKLTLKIDKSKLWLNENIGIGLIDGGTEQLKKIELDLKIQTGDIDLRELHNIIKIGSEISDEDNCKFIAKDGRFIVEIAGDTDIMRFDLGEAQGEGKALYSMSLLDTLLKGHNSGKLEFDNDKPLRMKIDEGEFKVEYLLAPRLV